MSSPGTPAAPATPADPAPAAPAAPATPTNTQWFDGFDAETKGYMENRGLTSKDASTAFQETAKAHREAVAKLGLPPERIVQLPKDTADAAGWRQAWERMGTPKDATGYALEKAEGDDDTFNKWAADEFNKLNMPKDMAEGFVKSLNAYTKQHLANEVARHQAAVEADKVELNKNWGQNAAINKIVAGNAAKKLGFTAEMVDALENVAGYAKVMEAFRVIGTKIGEDSFVTGGGDGTRIASRDGAVARIQQLTNDQSFIQKRVNGDAAAVQEWKDLHKVAYG